MIRPRCSNRFAGWWGHAKPVCQDGMLVCSGLGSLYAPGCRPAWSDPRTGVRWSRVGRVTQTIRSVPGTEIHCEFLRPVESREAAERLSPGREPWVERPSSHPSAPLSRAGGRGEGGEGGALTHSLSRGLSCLSPFGAELCYALRLQEGKVVEPGNVAARRGALATRHLALVTDL
jgi:hypothetical protein